MAMTITVGSGNPGKVLIVIPGTDLTSGAVWELRAEWTDGLGAPRSYRVRGGTGTPASAQVVLVDVAAPLNVVTTYRLLIDGATTQTATVTRTYSGDDVLLSLDGASAVPFLWESGGGDKREPERRFWASAVAGRARPPMRLDPVGGAGGGSLVAETSGAATTAMRALLDSNAPCHLLHNHAQCRTGCDIPETDIIYLTRASSDTVGITTHRRWSLSYLLIDDPEPSYAVPLSTWDEFDTAFATWTAFDAYFAGKTWDEFDRTDWSGIGA